MYLYFPSKGFIRALEKHPQTMLSHVPKAAVGTGDMIDLC